VELYGIAWVQNVWKYTIEDKQEFYRMLAQLIPLGRTAFGKEDGAQLKKYNQEIHNLLDSMTPWAGTARTASSGRSRHTALRERLLAQGVKPGEVVVTFEPTDIRNDPLYKDAKVVT